MYSYIVLILGGYYKVICTWVSLFPLFLVMRALELESSDKFLVLVTTYIVQQQYLASSMLSKLCIFPSKESIKDWHLPGSTLNCSIFVFWYKFFELFTNDSLLDPTSLLKQKLNLLSAIFAALFNISLGIILPINVCN